MDIILKYMVIHHKILKCKFSLQNLEMADKHNIKEDILFTLSKIMI